MTDIKLHPDTKALLDWMKAETPTDAVPIGKPGCQSAEEFRAECESLSVFNEKCKYNVTTQERRIESPNVSGGIPVSVYVPECLREDPSILVYVHGGGFVIGTIKLFEPCCQYIASIGQFIVVSVKYRHAPEYRFPAAHDDVIAAVEWVKKHRVELGGTSQSTVGIAGDSAGGNLAASAAHDVTGLGYQVLIYPWLDMSLSSKSVEKYADGYFCTKAEMLWFRQMCCQESDWRNPRLNLLERSESADVPPALFVLAEHDPLLCDSYAYIPKLADVEVYVVKGVIHAFAMLPGAFKESCADAYKRIADFINRHS